MSTNGEFPGAASIFGVWRGRLGALANRSERSEALCRATGAGASCR